MANLLREARLGRKITKEAYTKEVEKARIIICRRGDAACDRPTPETAGSFADICPTIAPKDKAVALKFYHVRYDGLTPAEKRPV